MDSLPTEMLEMILKPMKRRELCDMMLVCHKWKNISDHLWNYDDLEDFPKIKLGNIKVLTTNRFRRVKEICIVDQSGSSSNEKDEHGGSVSCWNEAFTLLKKLENLEVLELDGLNLDAVPIDTFFSVVEGKDELILTRVSLDSNMEIWNFLHQVIIDDYKDVDLNFWSCELTLIDCEIHNNEVSAPIIGRVLNRFYYLDLSLSSTEFLSIFFNLMIESTSIISLRLESCGLTLLDENVLSKALNKITNLSLMDGNFCLSNDSYQWKPFFNQMSISTSIKLLELKDIKLSAIDPEIFARAVNNVKCAQICEVVLSVEQCKAVLVKASKHTHLIELEMCAPEFSKGQLAKNVKAKIPKCILYDFEYKKGCSIVDGVLKEDSPIRSEETKRGPKYGEHAEGYAPP